MTAPDAHINAVKMRDAVAVANLVKSIGNGNALPPMGDSGWREVEDSLWTMYLSENVSLIYYQDPDDARIELLVADWCYGEVRGASISKVNGTMSLVIGMDDGTYVSTPISERTKEGSE